MVMIDDDDDDEGKENPRQVGWWWERIIITKQNWCFSNLTLLLQTWMWYKSSPTSWKHEQIWTCKCQLRQTYIYSASFTVSQWLQPNKLRPTLVINRLRITKWQCSPIRSRSQPSKRKCYKAKLCQKMCYKVKPHQKSAKKSNLARMKLPVTPVLQAQKP